jgi:hypothetical protein
MSTLRTRLPPRLPGARYLGFIVSLLGVMSTPCLAQGGKPTPVTLQDLTVPQDRLPTGCSLKAADPDPQRVRLISPMQSAGITTNPWTGTDRRILAWLRQSVDGYGKLRLPDGPPLTQSQESALFLRFADGVEEGYAATYAQSGAPDLEVQAVRFAVAPEKRFTSPTGGPNAMVIEIGSIRAVLHGHGGPCESAIDTHLKSFGK